MVSGIKISNLTFFGADTTTELEIPVALNAVRLSFDGLYSDVIIDTIDLNKHLVKNPTCTRYAVAEGTSMEGERVFHGSLLGMDTSIPYDSGKKVVVWLSEESLWSVKTLDIVLTPHGKKTYLVPAHPDLKPMLCTSPYDFIYGVLLWSIYPHSEHVRFN